MIERHYTINDLSEQLSMSFEKVRLLVKDEPGVLRIWAGKRSMYRIPESVLQRMLRRFANPPSSSGIPLPYPRA